MGIDSGFFRGFLYAIFELHLLNVQDYWRPRYSCCVMTKKITFQTTKFLTTTLAGRCFERFSSVKLLNTCPDEEGIKTRQFVYAEALPNLNTCPDEEGIKT